MSENVTEEQLLSMVLTRYENNKNVPEYGEALDFIKKLATVMHFEGDLERLIDTVLKKLTTRMSLGISLIGDNALHDRKWIENRDIDWVYSKAYTGYLKRINWPSQVVTAIDDSAYKILSYLQNPLSEGKWDRRGLVIGHVQSGKTANYLGLVTRAADAGYKLIIIVAGIQNSLRRQTQKRVEDGFIGRSSDNRKQPTGVGLWALSHGDGEHPYPVTLTTLNDDFSSKTAKQSGWMINDFSKPIVLVIKKNVKTLESLLRWLKTLNAKGDGKIVDVPLLMVDDEADNASINTNNPDSDPTKTNARIREILSTFTKASYVGYTATPFANIFINADSDDVYLGDDLFPRDFIHCLNASSDYFGPDKVFVDDEYSANILVEIDDAEAYIPWNHKRYFNLPNGLPPSIYEAVNVFIISGALRILRGQGNQHMSMMVNVSRFTDVQLVVKNIILDHIVTLRDIIKLYHMLPDDEALKQPEMNGLRQVFAKHFENCLNPGETWQNVKSLLYKAVAPVEVLLINSKSPEILDYDGYPSGRTVIAVGGIGLSRGLTLEGLSTSYLYRNTRMYDTLMQMGRWFGYRDGYEDLCKVWLSGQSIRWYNHIGYALEDLSQQIIYMEQKNCTPIDFGLYIRKSADSLMITAPAKMRSGVNVTMRWNLSGQLRETYLLPQDREINRQNMDLVKKYFESGFELGANRLEPARAGKAGESKGWIIRNIAVKSLGDFLMKFTVCPGFEITRKAVVDFLDTISGEYPVGDALFVSQEDKKPYGDAFPLGFQVRRPDMEKSTRFVWAMRKHRVASRGDEKLGLTDDQILAATTLAADSGKKPSDVHYRTERNKPLLMLHLVNFDENCNDLENMAPAFGFSFPRGEFEKSIDVTANAKYIEQMNEEFGSFDDEVEDE